MLEQAIEKLTIEIQRLREAIERQVPGIPLPEALLLRAPEAAKLLGISRASAYALLASGQLPHVRLGRSIRIPYHALRTFVAQESAT